MQHTNEIPVTEIKHSLTVLIHDNEKSKERKSTFVINMLFELLRKHGYDYTPDDYALMHKQVYRGLGSDAKDAATVSWNVTKAATVTLGRSLKTAWQEGVREYQRSSM